MKRNELEKAENFNCHVIFLTQIPCLRLYRCLKWLSDINFQLKSTQQRMRFQEMSSVSTTESVSAVRGALVDSKEMSHLKREVIVRSWAKEIFKMLSVNWHSCGSNKKYTWYQRQNNSNEIGKKEIDSLKCWEKILFFPSKLCIIFAS